MANREGNISTNTASLSEEANNVNEITNTEISPTHLLNNVNFGIFSRIAINNQQNDNYPDHFFDNPSSTTTNTKLIMTSSS